MINYYIVDVSMETAKPGFCWPQQSDQEEKNWGQHLESPPG